MTTQLTPEQVQAWVREARRCSDDSWGFSFGEAQLQRYTELARADLEVDMRQMAADLRRIQQIHDEQKARLYAERDALKDEVERLKADAKLVSPLTDEQISLMAHNEDPGDWNDLNYRDCWHKGFKAGVIEAMKGTP